MGFSPLLVSGLVCLMATFVGATMRCPVLREENESFVPKEFANQCPTYTNPHEEFCCYDLQLRARCCNFNDFVVNMSVLAVVVLILLMLLATVVSCVCCICCPFCFLYKRRHAGRVYESKSAPTAVSNRPNTEYTPIHKTHLPPGAYPVLPPTSEIRNYHSNR